MEDKEIGVTVCDGIKNWEVEGWVKTEEKYNKLAVSEWFVLGSPARVTL